MQKIAESSNPVIPKKKRLLILGGILLLPVLLCCISWHLSGILPPEEAALRQMVVDTAEEYLGCNEADGSHKKIIDLYNSLEPQARDYEVTYTDSWCAAFVSAVAIELELTDIIPAECGCEQQIYLFQAMGRWEERDTYIPHPGDLIYYAWDDRKSFGDCTGWADHVGFVVDSFGPFIKVIEGNKDDAVGYRYLLCNNLEIRGYGLPDYSSRSE